MLAPSFLSTALAFMTLQASAVQGMSSANKLLLVSMDGFRWDYIQKISGLGNFSRMARTGCSVEQMETPFVTVTFPCHYTMVTGLFVESHGIVANDMYDPIRNATFNKGSKESFWWEGGEPIWITAEKHKRNSSAVYFWPGSESVIQNLRPSIYKAYDGSVGYEERTRAAISWFVEEDKDFVALYFNEPDSTGHRFGPNSPEVADKVREMDGFLGLILKLLDEKNLTDVVNVIVTSDHGMAEIDTSTRLLNLWDYIQESSVDRIPSQGAVTAILPKAGREAEVMQGARKIPHVTAYRKEEIPEHFHYRNNPRIMPIIILADEGWLLTSKYEAYQKYTGKGGHGYSNQLPSMKSIFFARGPDFRKGVKSQSIRSVDLYPMMCRLLNLTAAPNNGSLENTAQFLASSAVTLRNGPAFFSIILVVLLYNLCVESVWW